MLGSVQSQGNARPVSGGQGDRRMHNRVKVSIFGRYMLPNRQEFPCQTIDMSPGGVALAAPVKGQIGDRVVAYLDTLGRIEGRIVRHLQDGFALELNTTISKRDKLADQLTWFANRSALGLPEDRRHERIVPSKPGAVMTLKDGSTEDVIIVDVSLSGAAIKSESKPPMYEIVTIGETRARVIRHFADGIAVEFTRLLPAERFDRDIVL